MSDQTSSDLRTETRPRGETATLAPRDFLLTAHEQGLLTPEVVHQLREQAAQERVDPATLVIQQGLMTPIQYEIVDTLRRPQQAIPGYEVLSVLGQGGMGVVYKARQLALNRLVALKTVLVTHASNQSALSRFEQEAQTVAKLLHPHIVTAYDFGRDTGRLYFAMEYVEGEDAEHYAKRTSPLPERLVWGLIRQAASGLAHAAQAGVVHRDVKPANLLLVTPPEGYPLPAGMPMVKIADFGLALLSEGADERTRLTSEQTTVGSPHYMAPEQLRAGGTVDLRADIYSLGATAFHLLAGQPPYHEATLPQIIAAKLSGELPDCSLARRDLSPESLKLLGDLMQKETDQRIGSYADVISRIDTLPVMIASEAASLSRRRSAANVPVAGTKLSNTRRQPIATGQLIGGAALAALATGIIVYVSGNGVSERPKPQPPAITEPGPTLVAAGWSASLFNGQSLSGWGIERGAWVVAKDDEEANVIAGTDGEIKRLLTKPVNGKTLPLEHYRVIVTARLNQARWVELQFDLQAKGARRVLRLTPDSLRVGRHSGGRTSLQMEQSPIPFDVGTDKLHELRLERHSSDWRLFVDDEPVATIPFRAAEPGKEAATGERESAEFRLVAEGGPAWFADATVEELGVK